MQSSTVWQKDASETEGEGIENSDQTSNAIWGRNVGYNRETRKTDWGERDENATMDVRSDTQRQDQERTHLRNNESDAGFQNCRERQGKGREDDRKLDTKTPGNETWKVLGWEQARRWSSKAMWGRKIVSHTGDPTWWEKPGRKKTKRSPTSS